MYLSARLPESVCLARLPPSDSSMREIQRADMKLRLGIVYTNIPPTNATRVRLLKSIKSGLAFGTVENEAAYAT